MKEQKTLNKFCRKLVALDMDIFGLRKQAQDAEPEGDVKWRTLENGVHFPIKGGESVKEAAEKFIAKKETEKGKVSQRGRTGISKGVPEAMQKAEKKLKEMNESLAKQTPMLPKNEGTIGGRGRVAFPEQSKSAQPKQKSAASGLSASETESFKRAKKLVDEYQGKYERGEISKEDFVHVKNIVDKNLLGSIQFEMNKKTPDAAAKKEAEKTSSSAHARVSNNPKLDKLKKTEYDLSTKMDETNEQAKKAKNAGDREKYKQLMSRWATMNDQLISTRHQIYDITGEKPWAEPFSNYHSMIQSERDAAKEGHG